MTTADELRKAALQASESAEYERSNLMPGIDPDELSRSSDLLEPPAVALARLGKQPACEHSEMVCRDSGVWVCACAYEVRKCTRLTSRHVVQLPLPSPSL